MKYVTFQRGPKITGPKAVGVISHSFNLNDPTKGALNECVYVFNSPLAHAPAGPDILWHTQSRSAELEPERLASPPGGTPLAEQHSRKITYPLA